MDDSKSRKMDDQRGNLKVSLTRGAAKFASTTDPAPSPHEMTSEGKEYVLQGCYAQAGTEDIGTMLGQDYAVPETNNMSLSFCLKTCASAVVYPFVGVASGEYVLSSSCYCGTTFNATTPKADSTDCTLSCVGNSTEACGGKGYISIYQSNSADLAAQPNSSSSSDGSLASSDPAAQPNSAGSHGSGASISGLSDTDTSGSSNPGVIAGITIGSVSGVVGLALLVFMAARWCTRRGHTQLAATVSDITSSSVTTLTATNNIHDAASIRDAVKIDVRRLDGVVMDQHSPSHLFARKNQIGVAATTGADWPNNKSSSPLTPRTPRFADIPEETHTSAPSIVVHPPEIAPVHGLGDRAWHRRRLSAPFPPAGAVDHGLAAREDGKQDDRRALPSQSSGEISAVDSADMPTWRGGQDAVSALSEDKTSSSSPSWRWTMSTASETLDTESEKAGIKA
ncbi:hypothetical protein N0V82_005475 [Gnomoniopsis sp. IMI 355080]|nr:hypothetical protein N0V82_005475 [Gnomoniopsis sp. IMI 355080]